MNIFLDLPGRMYVIESFCSVYDEFARVVLFIKFCKPLYAICVVYIFSDRTARLWRTDQVQALRIFAGHVSDVEVND